MKVKLVRWIGFIWLGLASLVLIASMVGTVAVNGWREGVGNIMMWFSPYNIANFLMLILLFGPGAWLVSLSEKWSCEQ